MAAKTNFVFSKNVTKIIMNFDELCRFCLSETQNDVSIRDKCLPEGSLEIEQDTIYSFVTKFKIIKMTSFENFPSLVCKNCCEVIKICYNFIKVCQKSEDLLNSCYEKSINLLNNITDIPDKNLEDINIKSQVDKKSKEISKVKKIKIEKKLDLISEVMNEFPENFKSRDFKTSINLSHKNETCCCSLCLTKFGSSQALNLHHTCTHEKCCRKLFIKQENPITQYITTKNKQISYQPKQNFNKMKNFVQADVNALYCYYCTPYKEFETKGDLLEHMKYHQIKDYYNCPNCDRIFFCKISLYQHCITFHNLSLWQNSKFLGQKHVDIDKKGDELILSISNLLKFYQDKNKSLRLCCKNCSPSMNFSTANEFIKHMTAHHFYGKFIEDKPIKGKAEVENNLNLKCSDCSATFSQKQYLLCHMRQKHNKQNHKSVKCPVCPETFFTNRKVIQHGITAHQKYFASFHNVFNKIMEPSHKEVIQNKDFECDICQKRYSFKTSLKKHIFSSHLGEPKSSVICPHCGKTVANKFNLKSHIEFKHEALFVSCPICNKKINFKTLGRHYRVHQNASELNLKNSYLCNQCGKIIKSQRSFEDHQKLHKNIRNELCDVCGGGYTTKKSLRLHKKTHEGMQRKLYECDQCDKVFSGRHTLSRHLLTHSGVKNFICEICSKCFYTLQELKRHVRYHKKEYRFECQQCDMRFVDKSRFRHHLMKHKNIRPHKCQFCEKMFIVRGKMNLHMASKHNFQVDSCRVWKDPKAYVPLEELL